MGFKISSEKYFDDVRNMNQRVVKRRPKFIKLNDYQTKLTNTLGNELDDTCTLCGNLKDYTDMIILSATNNPTVEMPLPHEEILCFDKRNVSNNSTEQISEINYHMQKNGFLSLIGIAYLGRLLMSMKTMIDDDIKDEQIKNNVLPCRQSIDKSLGTLKTLCGELPKEHIENLNVIWIVKNTPLMDDWHKFTDNRT